jgi:hypothetical protein
MLEFVVNDPSRNPMGYQLSPGGVTPRLLAQRNKANNNLLGPPQLVQIKDFLTHRKLNNFG